MAEKPYIFTCEYSTLDEINLEIPSIRFQSFNLCETFKKLRRRNISFVTQVYSADACPRDDAKSYSSTRKHHPLFLLYKRKLDVEHLDHLSVSESISKLLCNSSHCFIPSKVYNARSVLFIYLYTLRVGA